MSFSHLHEALQAHVEGELLPGDVQRWLLSGLARFVHDDEPLERALGLTRHMYQLHLRDTALRQAFEHVGSVDDLLEVIQCFDSDPSSELELHLAEALACVVRMPDRRQLRRIVGKKPAKLKRLYVRYFVIHG